MGELTVENMTVMIESAASESIEIDAARSIQQEEATPLVLTMESYELLTASFSGVSDEHMIQLLVQRLNQL